MNAIRGFSFLALFVLASCANLQTSGDTKNKVQDKYESIFLNAKKKVEADQYAQAKPLLEEYIKKSPNGTYSDHALLFLGQLAFRDAKYSAAEAYFNRIVSRAPISPMADLAKFYRARTWDAQGKKLEALGDLATLQDSRGTFPDAEKLKLYMFWGKLAKENNQVRDSALAYRKAYSLAEKNRSPHFEEIKAQLLTLIQSEMNYADLQSFLQYTDAKSLPGQWASKRFSELSVGQLENGLPIAQGSPSTETITPSQPEETVPLQNMNLNDLPETFGEANRLGILLPISNSEKAWGKSIYDGIKLALKKSSSEIQILVEDPGPNLTTAKEAFEKLTREQKVMAIVGPVSGEQAAYFAKKAHEQGILYLSTSPRTQLTWGASTINFSFDFKKQAEALVRYASENLNAKRYAMMFPRDDFGKGFAEAFSDSVLKHGGTFTSIESFPAGQSDFRKNVENMVGLGNLIHARWSERDLLVKEYAKKLGRPLKDKEKKSITLPPIVDFDVCFIPDSFKVIGQVAPLFSYFDIEGVTLMGPSTWNSSQVIQRAGQFLEDSYFVDFFSKTSPNEVAKEFLKSFEMEYGKVPGAMSALGYDLGMALDRVFKDSTSNRKSLLSKSVNLGEFVGALGLEKWDSSRDPMSEVQLFKIKKNNINWQQSVRVR